MRWIAKCIQANFDDDLGELCAIASTSNRILARYFVPNDMYLNRANVEDWIATAAAAKYLRIIISNADRTSRLDIGVATTTTLRSLGSMHHPPRHSSKRQHQQISGVGHYMRRSAKRPQSAGAQRGATGWISKAPGPGVRLGIALGIALGIELGIALWSGAPPFCNLASRSAAKF